LEAWCELAEPTRELKQLRLSQALTDAFGRLIDRALDDQRPLRLAFEGPPAAGFRYIAEGVASQAGFPLLIAALERGVAAPEVLTGLGVLARQAGLHGWVVCFEHTTALSADDHAAQRRALRGVLERLTGISIVCGSSLHPELTDGATPVVLSA